MIQFNSIKSVTATALSKVKNKVAESNLDKLAKAVEDISNALDLN